MSAVATPNARKEPGATSDVTPRAPAAAGLGGLLRPYAGLIGGLVVLTMVGNSLTLLVPRIVARAIDSYTQQQLVMAAVSRELLAVALGIALFTYLQTVVQTRASERVAKDLRTRLIAKISVQDHAYVQQVTPARLLTHLTSDVDAIKLFVSLAVASLVSSAFLIVGASLLLLSIDWQLALAVLAILPIIGMTFFVVLGRVRPLFTKAQEAIDRLNRVINESILASALVRLLNSRQFEHDKFVAANTEAKRVSLAILRQFAGLIPVILFATNLATLMILTLGGRFVIQGSMTLGDFTAFNGYLSILVFPVIMIGFMSNVMAQANASYARIATVLHAPDRREGGDLSTELRGDIAVRDLALTIGDKAVLKGVSLTAAAGSRTAVIGPTAAGKTQLLYLLAGLATPQSGAVEYDGRNIGDYDSETLHRQVGLVFQDSIIFNLTLRENVAFSKAVRDEDLDKALATAELTDFIAGLPDKLDTVVSERGGSLSGGQKQRIMLARALALNPRVLLLDDFTARVDSNTERRILDNVHRNYPGLTLLSVTQQIAAVEDYDQIVLLMEGEVLAAGTHRELLDASPEYVQIYDSQRSTDRHELLHAE